MINENELLTWLDSHKRAAKIPPIVSDGKYTMIVEFVPLLRHIREMAADSRGGDTGVSEKGAQGCEDV